MMSKKPRCRRKKVDLYEYTYEEIAQELGITPRRVRQILCESIAKIRRNLGSIEILREFMDWSRERRQAEGYVARDGIRL